jgi:hypothetical protein
MGEREESDEEIGELADVDRETSSNMRSISMVQADVDQPV